MSKQLERILSKFIKMINKQNLTEKELIHLLGELLIRGGFSIHWGIEKKGEKPPSQISERLVDNLLLEGSTKGLTLMKIGFSLIEDLAEDNV